MIPYINFDTILSDPMLLVATVLLILGPLVFLFALVKFILSKKNVPPPLVIEETPLEPSVTEEEPTREPVVPPQVQAAPVIEEKISPASMEHFPAPPPTPPVSGPRVSASDKTIVMPPGMGEIHGQIEIVFSQIKMLNKKVYEIESEIESLSRVASSKLDTNELKEPPMNPAEFTQKLLKLAEHVIVLEKEVARIKTNNSTPIKTETPAAPTPSKPPIMPI